MLWYENIDNNTCMLLWLTPYRIEASSASRLRAEV